MDIKRQPTISVRNMGKLLGLKKVESYWLVHKGYFRTILVNGKMRVVMESFEHWYAGQIKYHKVNGEPPGKRLKQESYSARDIGEILQISEARAYEVMKMAGIKPIIVDFWQRFPKSEFDRWYAGQNRYRNQEDRKRDAFLENNSMSMPDMARLLDVPRSVVYGILKSEKGKAMLETLVIADRRRITIESFNRWYVSQTEYFKPEDQPEGVPRKWRTYADSLEGKKIRVGKQVRTAHASKNADYLTADEAAILAKVTVPTVYSWISSRKVPALRVSRKVMRIPRAEFEAFLLQMKENEGGNNGVDR